MIRNAILGMVRQRLHAFTLLGYLFVLLTTMARGEEPPLPTISVSGHAELQVVPDQVTLQFGLEARAKQLSDAVNENNDKIAKVIEFLRTLDIKDRNIRTESLLIRPIYAHDGVYKAQQQSNDPFGRQMPASGRSGGEATLTPTGYMVQRKLKITTSQIDRFEQVYRGLIEHGVNQIDSIAFSTTKLREHRDAARISAIRAAREKAEGLAGELGTKLSGVQSITEGSSARHDRGQNVLVDDLFGEAPEARDSVAAGEIEINATVHVVFRLSSTEFK